MTATQIQTRDETAGACFDEYRSHVSMHHTDAAGVVYVGAPYQWAQVGMENLLREVGHPVGSLHHTNIHYPMVRQVINHHRSLHLGDELTVRTWIDRVGTRSFTVACNISKVGGEVHVTVEFTAVANGRDGTKPPVEDWLRELHVAARRNGLSLENETGGES